MLTCICSLTENLRNTVSFNCHLFDILKYHPPFYDKFLYLFIIQNLSANFEFPKTYSFLKSFWQLQFNF